MRHLENDLLPRQGQQDAGELGAGVQEDPPARPQALHRLSPTFLGDRGSSPHSDRPGRVRLLPCHLEIPPSRRLTANRTPTASLDSSPVHPEGRSLLPTDTSGPLPKLSPVPTYPAHPWGSR